VRLQERLAAVQQQRSLLDQEEREIRRAAEAIAIEERGILLREQQEQVDGVEGMTLENPSLHSSPFTCIALKD
jgi:vacuolar-type H+-ATPase subunit E/Vma4